MDWNQRSLPASVTGHYALRVEIRSLGYRTDLLVRGLEGSQVEDRGDHLVVRSPRSPEYWWGNFLLLPELKPGEGANWLGRFAAEFPSARHVALGIDVTDSRAVDPRELTAEGLSLGQDTVLVASGLRPPPRPSTGAAYRTLEGDDDWRQAARLRATVSEGEPGGEPVFMHARLAAERALAEAGHGSWFGAFIDGELVADLGVILDKKTGLARYQSVQTHPAARRRGLAGTLVWRAGQGVLATGRADMLVIVADPADVAIRVYQSVGFTPVQDQISFARPPAET